MSQALTLARPYARAAFGIARDEGKFDAWSRALGLAAQIAADPTAAAALANPGLRQSDAVALLSSDDGDTTFGRFLAMLFDNRRLPLLPEIAGLYEQQRAEEERIVKARVTSAAALPQAELSRITEALRRRFGREVEVSTRIDESLIGGAVIDAGDVVIDGSLKGKLARLQNALAQ